MLQILVNILTGLGREFTGYLGYGISITTSRFTTTNSVGTGGLIMNKGVIITLVFSLRDFSSPDSRKPAF